MMDIVEFREYTKDIPSAWRGFEKFAYQLVHLLQPKVTVELGVNWGYSLVALARADIGHVYGVDVFEPLDYIKGWGGPRDDYPVVKELITPFLNIELIKGWFADVASTWDKPIDILHIDGNHTYHDIVRDYEAWSPHVAQDGVILLHDVIAFPEYGSFFYELDACRLLNDYDCGLGIIGSRKVIKDIYNKFPNLKVVQL